MSAQTLLRGLRDRELLARVEQNREVLTVRETLEGRRQDMVCLLANCPYRQSNPTNRTSTAKMVGLLVGKTKLCEEPDHEKVNGIE